VAEHVGRIVRRYGKHASGRLEDDLNLYAYVGNDALNRGDPLGLAELSFMHDSDPKGTEGMSDEADAFDSPYYDIASHGTEGHPAIYDNGTWGNTIRPEALAAQIQTPNHSANYSAILLAACHIGDWYAQRLADASKKPVLFTSGRTMYSSTRAPSGEIASVTIAAQGGRFHANYFRVAVPSGTTSSLSSREIKSITYDTKTGMATIKSADSETGTRLQRTESVCANRDKCGK
jgi:hypothetical protein